MSPTVLTTFPGVLPWHSDGRGCSRQCVDPSGGHQDKNSIIERSLLALIYQRFLLRIIFLLLSLESLATDCLALLPLSLCHFVAFLFYFILFYFRAIKTVLDKKIIIE